MATWLVTCTPSSSVMPPLASMKLKAPMNTWSASVQPLFVLDAGGRRNARVGQQPAAASLTEQRAKAQQAHSRRRSRLTDRAQCRAHVAAGAAGAFTGQVASFQKYQPKYRHIAADTAQPAAFSPPTARPTPAPR